eukprot:2373847-Amphidinium_carterae.1
MDSTLLSAHKADTLTCCTIRSKLLLPNAFIFFDPSPVRTDVLADNGVASAENDTSNGPPLYLETKSFSRSYNTNWAV